ncbi:MAG: BMP family ABC transporter substrate-binding protein [Kineosporiaceae bacterium]
MRRSISFASVAVLASVLLAGCGGGGEDPEPGAGGSGGTTSDVKVGLAYDIGGRGDQSFNDSAAAGLDKAKSEFGIEIKELEASQNETDAQKEERLRLLASGGYDPVLAIGFAYATALGKVAPEFPDTTFAIVDDSSLSAKNKNVTSLVFAEEQGSYLVGVIAAQASKSGKVGFVGGVNVPLIQKFEAGFTAGVKAAKPQTTVQVKYLSEPPDFSGFGNPAAGKAAAQGMLDAGADVVYAAAGGSGAGVFEAVAAKPGSFAIGVDSDQYKTADDALKPIILTSMLKKVDVAVYDAIKASVNGSPLTGVQVFDLKQGGIDYSTSNSAVQPFTAKADEAKAKIGDGSVTVPTAK